MPAAAIAAVVAAGFEAYAIGGIAALGMAEVIGPALARATLGAAASTLLAAASSAQFSDDPDGPV